MCLCRRSSSSTAGLAPLSPSRTLTSTSLVVTSPCTNTPNQKFLTLPSTDANAFTIAQDEGVLCLAAPLTPPPHPPHPPPGPSPAPTPGVNESDWDAFLTVEQNWIYDIPREFHGGFLE